MVVHRRLIKYFKFSTCIQFFLLVLLLQLLFIYYFIGYNIIIPYKGDIPHDNLTQYPLFISDFPHISEASWQNIGGITEFKFLVYSAFLDIRSKRMIRVIAVTKVKKPKVTLPKVWCKLLYQKGDRYVKTKTLEGQLTVIKEHWNLPYSAYYITCPIGDNATIPDGISLLSAPEQTPENHLKVIVNYDEKIKWNPLELSPLVNKIAVCVKPLHYNYNPVYELLEFIELHQIMGVNHFFLYNHTVGPQVDCLLKKYQNDGIVTILPWQLPIESQKEIRTEGLFASLNDCLYRTMHKYSHTIFIDFDEFIIPRNNCNSYRQLFEYLAQQYNIKRQSTFSFQNAFFYRQWPDDPDVKLLNDPIAEHLIILKKTTRKAVLHVHRTRSKFIVRPELVNMVGNHFIWEYYNRMEFGVLNVNPKEAFLHHYRVCEFGGDDCVSQASTVDKTAYRYKDALITAVTSRYNEYLTDCNLANSTD